LLRWGGEFPIVYKIHIDGLQQQKVVHGQQPSWSPDGQWIAFTDNALIFRIRHSENLTVQITDDLFFVDMMPAFSPDGRNIAFVSFNQIGIPHIYVIDIDTGKRKRLTDASGDWYLNPCWSPDGKYIAFECNDSIRIMNSRGGDERILIENAEDPSWSPCRSYAVSPYDRVLATWGVLKAIAHF